MPKQIPLSHISEDVYKTSVDWISGRSSEALGSFVLWSLDSILTDLASHQGTVKGSKKVIQQAPSKSQVTISHTMLQVNYAVVNFTFVYMILIELTFFMPKWMHIVRTIIEIGFLMFMEMT